MHIVCSEPMVWWSHGCNTCECCQDVLMAHLIFELVFGHCTFRNLLHLPHFCDPLHGVAADSLKGCGLWNVEMYLQIHFSLINIHSWKSSAWQWVRCHRTRDLVLIVVADAENCLSLSLAWTTYYLFLSPNVIGGQGLALREYTC